MPWCSSSRGGVRCVFSAVDVRPRDELRVRHVDAGVDDGHRQAGPGRRRRAVGADRGEPPLGGTSGSVARRARSGSAIAGRSGPHAERSRAGRHGTRQIPSAARPPRLRRAARAPRGERRERCAGRRRARASSRRRRRPRSAARCTGIKVASFGVRAYIGIGANLGDREGTIRDALGLLGDEVVAVSELRETEPWGYADQPRVPERRRAARDRAVAPRAARRLLEVERELGRVRDGPRFGPRTIDLDLLLYGDASSTSRASRCRIRACTSGVRARAARRPRPGASRPRPRPGGRDLLAELH